MTEADEVAESIFKQHRDRDIKTFADARALTKEQMFPDESATVIDNVAHAVFQLYQLSPK